jgi:hypothetical protein
LLARELPRPPTDPAGVADGVGVGSGVGVAGRETTLTSAARASRSPAIVRVTK